jgi:ABC-type antimicrobial peptide transport system permease subunit
LITAAVLLTAAAVVAALVPAARASRVDVVTALRSE